MVVTILGAGFPFERRNECFALTIHGVCDFLKPLCNTCSNGGVLYHMVGVAFGDVFMGLMLGNKLVVCVVEV